nr:hypothetical protein [Tanacetum cinerariifolium]
MAISVVSVSSEESMGTPVGRVILFGTIPTTIFDTTPTISPPATHTDTTEIPTIAATTPLSPDYTPVSHDYSHAPDTELDLSEDPPSDHIPPLPAILPFLSSIVDTTYSDTPPSPTHGTPFTKITSSTQISPIIPHHRVMKDKILQGFGNELRRKEVKKIVLAAWNMDLMSKVDDYECNPTGDQVMCHLKFLLGFKIVLKKDVKVVHG